MFLGFVTLGTNLVASVLTRNTSNTPINADGNVSYRVYGDSGLMASGSGTASFRNTGNLTNATNASPIVCTSSAHGLSTGTRVFISGVTGNTAANGNFNVTVLTANTFSLDSSTGNGTYVSGGSWNTAGLYAITHAVSTGNGYEAGDSYSLLVSYQISSTAMAQLFRFVAV